MSEDDPRSLATAVDLTPSGTSAMLLRDPVGRATDGNQLDRLFATLLSALAEIGGFEATYVTAIDWKQRQQEVRYVHNAGDYEVPLGMQIDCPTGLSERALLGVTRSNELPTAQPDSQMVRTLGLATYASVPIITEGHHLYGTLCGVSRERREVPDDAISTMESFAQMIVDQMTRDDATRDSQRTLDAEDQLRDRGLFLAQAEHKLKTPLAVLAGWAETLLAVGQSIPEEERAAGLEAIVRNAKILAERIDCLLEESMAEVPRPSTSTLSR